jgi:hypothetical protein
MATAGTIASRAYAPKPGAPARPAIVRQACQQLAGGKNNTGEALLTQNRKHYSLLRLRGHLCGFADRDFGVHTPS